MEQKKSLRVSLNSPKSLRGPLRVNVGHDGWEEHKIRKKSSEGRIFRKKSLKLFLRKTERKEREVFLLDHEGGEITAR